MLTGTGAWSNQAGSGHSTCLSTLGWLGGRVWLLPLYLPSPQIQEGRKNAKTMVTPTFL